MKTVIGFRQRLRQRWPTKVNLGQARPEHFLKILSNRVTLLLALTAAGQPALQPVADPQPILQALQRKMSSLRSVLLDFTQERHLKLFLEPLKSEGVMLLEKP